MLSMPRQGITQRHDEQFLQLVLHDGSQPLMQVYWHPGLTLQEKGSSCSQHTPAAQGMAGLLSCIRLSCARSDDWEPTLATGWRAACRMWSAHRAWNCWTGTDSVSNVRTPLACIMLYLLFLNLDSMTVSTCKQSD